jgi:hypothetical protein
MIDQRFIEFMAQDLIETPKLDQQDVQLASANTGVTTDGGAFVGYRLNMPKGLNTRENQAKQSVLIADTLAGGGKGAVQGFVGLPGDLESIGRMALGYLGYNVDENTVLPTSEEIGKRLESALGPVIPQGQATGVLTEERVRAAEGGELGGELLAPGGQIALGAKVAKPVIGATKKIIEAGKDLPVGMSIKAVDESLDPLGFYSAASKAVDNIAQEKGTGAQFLAQIEKTPGVKKEELLWTGLDDFLKGKKSVTKAEVQEYLNANRVEVKEVTLNEGARPYRYVTANEWQGAINDAERAGNFDEAERITAAWENFELGGGADKPKFAKFTLPGGENYREIYLTLPSKVNEDQIAQEMYGVPFDKLMGRARADVVNKMSESRFIVPRAHSGGSTETDWNRLAQIRVNDRVDADGKKVLFVEEIQSDWHQAGRKKGYKGDINEAAKEYTSILKEYGDKLATEMPAEVRARLNELRPIVSKNATEAVPNAPFKTSWHELALKRAIQLASEGGYDRIAFTTGKTQAERYDLSKQISKISYEKGDNGMYDLIANDMDGTEVLFKEDIPLSEVEDIIGKDMAKKIANDEGKPGDGTGYRNWKTFRGVDLQVGGEGMAGFYDNILPKYLDKYGKKWDAKTGMTAIKADGSDASVHYMDITPKMKESVLTKGQPLFQMAPAIPAGVAAGQQEDNK